MTAHVAKGFALFGQQKYALAVHAFNVALRECDVRDKVFVSLVKVSPPIHVRMFTYHFSLVTVYRHVRGRVPC